MPQLLRAAGLTSYVFLRPSAAERELPAQLFRWRDLSGAEVLAYRIPYAYETGAASEVAGLLAEGSNLAAAEQTPLMLFIGVGNQGGGPTRATLAEVDRLRTAYPSVEYSDPGQYLAAVPGVDAPVVTGKLQHHAVGCYSASAWVKAAHDHAEAALLDAEGIEAIAAMLAGRDARQPELSAAWTELLLVQFHDVLAGSASSRAYQTMRARLGHVNTVADVVATNALYQLAHRVDTTASVPVPVKREWSFWAAAEANGVPFLVCNPLPWAVRQPVTAARPAAEVLDSSGQLVTHQAVASGEVTLFASHTLFLADLPPLLYELFWLRGEHRGPDVAADEHPVIENDLLCVAADPDSGAIVSVTQKASGRELVDPAGIRLVLQRDMSDTWSHHLYEEENLADMSFGGWDLVESGPVRWTAWLRFRFDDSLASIDASLLAGEPYVQLRLRADWRMPHVVLKLVLPCQLGPQVRIKAGAAYGVAERVPAGDEDPVHGWLDCFDPSSGLWRRHHHRAPARIRRDRLVGAADGPEEPARRQSRRRLGIHPARGVPARRQRAPRRDHPDRSARRGLAVRASGRAIRRADTTAPGDRRHLPLWRPATSGRIPHGRTGWLPGRPRREARGVG